MRSILRDRPILAGVALGALVGLAVYPVLGLSGSIELGVVTFYVVALVQSGYRRDRVLAWGALVSLLFIASALAPEPLAIACLAAAAGLFFAAVLSPAVRRNWFGPTAD